MVDMEDRYNRVAYMGAIYTRRSMSVYIDADDKTCVGLTAEMPQGAKECVRFEPKPLTPASAQAAPVPRPR